MRLVRSWGRIATIGQEMVEVYATKIKVGKALEAVARLGKAAAGVIATCDGRHGGQIGQRERS